MSHHQHHPFFLAISINSSHSWEDAAIGFSIKVCLPDSKLALAIGKCNLTDVAMITASTDAVEHVIVICFAFNFRV